MSEQSNEPRAIFPECPNCDEVVETKNLALGSELECPMCGAKLLYVRLDGINLFLKDGWL